MIYAWAFLGALILLFLAWMAHYARRCAQARTVLVPPNAMIGSRKRS